MSCVFKPGDVVSLRSGGPSMTVSYITPASISGKYDQVVTVWISDEGYKHESYFNDNQLKRASDPDDDDDVLHIAIPKSLASAVANAIRSTASHFRHDLKHDPDDIRILQRDANLLDGIADDLDEGQRL